MLIEAGDGYKKAMKEVELYSFSSHDWRIIIGVGVAGLLIGLGVYHKLI